MTHANRGLRHPFMQALRDSISTSTAILGSALFGLVAATHCCAQQPTGWSPQPFQKPNAEVSNAQQIVAPRNSLRRNEVEQNGEVLRWGSPNNALRTIRAEPSYSQAMPPKGTQVQSDNLAKATVSKIIHQPAGSVATTRPPSSEPKSGFDFSAPGKRNEVRVQMNVGVQQFSHVQLASHNEHLVEAPSQERRTNGVWLDRSATKTLVQTAKFQEPQAGTAINLLPQELPPAKDLLPIEPKAIQPSMQGKSLLEPEQIRPSPFPKQENNDRSPSVIEEPPRSKSRRDPAPEPPQRAVDCDSVRQNAKDSDITKIRIDSSPSFVEGYNNPDRSEDSTKMGFIASAPIRPWLSYDGQVVVEGKLLDLRLGSVVIERADGTQTSYLLHKLSDADQVYVSEKWGLPVTCSIDDRSFPRRDFVDTTVTWKATGACHKPLYFEDVQLERYGHEWGPIAQPVISTAHFFGDVIVLPYKMGIHPMNECQYSLGHYRPGSCAPWTIGPVPISLRGALMQAKVITGAALILP